MGKNGEISQPDDKAEKPSTSKQAETKPKDFAAGWNISEHNMQPEVPRDHSPSDTNLHSKRQTSNEEQRDEIAHLESGLRSASGDETGGQGQLGQNMSDWKAWYQNKATSNKVLDELIAKRLGQKEDLYHKMCDLNNKTLDYEEKYYELEKDRSTIEKEINRSKEEYNDFSKKYEALETKINGLNSEIASKEQKQKELLFHFDKLIEEQNKTQGDYDRFTKEIGTQIGSQSESLQKELKNVYNYQIKLQKQLELCKNKISKKEKAKFMLENELYKIEYLEQNAQKTRTKERNVYEIEMKNSIAQEIISYHEKLKNHLERLKVDLKCKKENLEHKKVDLDNFKKELENNIKILEENKDNYFDSLLKHIEYHKNLNGAEIQLIVDKIETIENGIKGLESGITDIEGEIEKYSRSLDLSEQSSSQEIQGVDLSENSYKQDELAHFGDQLMVINKYTNNNTKGLMKELLSLKDHNKDLQDIKEHSYEKNYTIDKLEKQAFIKVEQLTHKIYLEERKTLIQECQLYNKNFQAQKYNYIQKKYDSIIESYENLMDRNTKNKNVFIRNIKDQENKMELLYQEIKKVEDNLKTEFKHVSAQELRVLESGTEGPSVPNDQCSQATLSQDTRKITELLGERLRIRKDLYSLGERLLQHKDDWGRAVLDGIAIAAQKDAWLSKWLEAYQSDLKNFDTKKPDLKIKIDTELMKIRSQCETNLQDLQKFYNEKESELNTLQSKLAIFEKNMQQETKRQELQGQLDRLASQVNTARHESETITQELEDYRQKLENSRKELDAADQKKLLLGTKIEHAKKKLEEIEKEMKIAENKWRGKYYEYIKTINELMHLKNIGEMTKVILEKAKKYQEVKNKYEHAKGEYEHTKNEHEYAEYNYKHAEYQYKHAEYQHKQAENKYEHAKGEYEHTKNKYKHAEYQYKNAEYQYKNAEYKLTNELQIFKNMVQRPNSLPHGRDLSTEGLPPNQRPQQALKKVSKACTELSYAWTELPHACTEWSHAWTELSHAWTELSRAWTELPNASTKLSHARTELSHAWTELSHARTELSHAWTELSHARTELLEARIDTSNAVITRAPLDDEERTWMREAKEEAMQSREWRPPQPKRPWDEAAEVK